MAGVTNAPFGQDQWQMEMLTNLMVAVPSGILLVFAVLVLLYHRIISPLVNMGSLFLAPLGGLVALIVFLLAACVVLILANSRKNFGKGEGQPSGKSSNGDQAQKPQLIERITRDMVPFRPPSSEDKTRTAPQATTKKSEAPALSLPSISIVAETPSTTEEKNQRCTDGTTTPTLWFRPDARLEAW